MNSEVDSKRKRKRSLTPSSRTSSSYSSPSRDHKSRRKDKHSKHSRSRNRSHDRSKSKSHHHHSSKDKKKKEKEKEKEKEREKEKEKEKSHKHSKKDKKHSSHSKSKSKEEKSEKSSSQEDQTNQVNMMQNSFMYQMGMNKNMFFPPIQNPMLGMQIPPMKKFDNNQPMPPLITPLIPGPVNSMQNQMNILANMSNMEGPPDKIVKDQNFLNSDEKLFETIVNHEMSMKTLFADCQFSESYLGGTLFRSVKKHVFDSSTVIFEEGKESGRSPTSKNNYIMPDENELIQQKIDDIKKKTQKINFGDLSSFVQKLLLIKQSEGTIDENMLMNNTYTQNPMEVEIK